MVVSFEFDYAVKQEGNIESNDPPPKTVITPTAFQAAFNNISLGAERRFG